VIGRQLRDFAVVAVLALIIATAAFVAVRNNELAARQIALAERAAAALRDHAELPPTVNAVIVSAATPSPRHPFLRKRQVLVGDRWQPLQDKLLYDAAMRFDREGAVSELLGDASGRALVARCTVDTRPCPRIAVALTSPARPAPYPFLVIIGVLGLGTALAAAGALLGPVARRGGLFAGAGALAVPALLWHAPVAATVILLLGAGVALAQQAALTDRIAAAMIKSRVALSFLTPAATAMFVLVAAPFAIGILLGFHDHHHGTWTFVGLSNFSEILSGGGHSLDDPLNFWFILGVTVLWTVANIVLHVTIGVALALALSRKWLVGRGVFRMLLILPWAIPNYITALIWHGMFEGEYGAINSLLRLFGLSDVSWFSSWATAFSADVIANTWLGFPFMMVVALGALETISPSLYEAASVDGANAWQRFRHITLPHLRPALGPAVALGSIWTFNMFNIIYLVSRGKPGNATNILVTDAYRWAFERGERYGMAAAYATIIFLILLVWTVFGTRMVRREEA